MLLQHMQPGLSSGIRPSSRPCCLAPCRQARGVQLGAAVRRSRSAGLKVSAVAAAAAVPGPPDASQKPFWAAAMQWWDVGQSENDKNRQPGKLSDTLHMAWQLIAQEKKLMAVASFLMVSEAPWQRSMLRQGPAPSDTAAHTVASAEMLGREWCTQCFPGGQVSKQGPVPRAGQQTAATAALHAQLVVHTLAWLVKPLCVCAPLPVCPPVQVAASVCELIMPYFYSKILCSISKPGFQEVFHQNLMCYGAFALGFAVFAAGRGALFGVINNKLSRSLR